MGQAANLNGATADDSVAAIVTRFKPAFDNAVARENKFRANRIALKAADALFSLDADEARTQIWEHFYGRLKKNGVQYQCYDFESVDYELYEISGLTRMVRGPCRGLAETNGRYITFLGAAQFFGRYLRRALHSLVEEALGVTCVNLSFGGAGPETFYSKNILRVANGGRAVVLQVLSAKGSGCGEYPGRGITAGKDGNKIKRLRLLQEVWDDSRSEAIRLTMRWQQSYIESMTSLLRQFTVPVVLVWMSSRAPEDWSLDHLNENVNFGDYPQLVDKPTLDRLVGGGQKLVSVCRDEGLPYKFVSRFTGENCPALHRHGGLFWRNKYYPSPLASGEVSARVVDVLKSMNVVN